MSHDNGCQTFSKSSGAVDTPVRISARIPGSKPDQSIFKYGGFFLSVILTVLPFLPSRYIFPVTATMIHRTAAFSKIQHRCQCPGNIFASFHCRIQIIAFCQIDAMALESVQPVPWVFGLSIRLPLNHS